jgi:hypothetical protein
MKCAEDPVYFIETYMTIINLDEGEVKFKLRDYQKDMLNAMVDHNRVLILSCRQSGKSISTCAFFLHYIIFNSHKSVVILANKGETAREILSRVQFAYERLPLWLKHGVAVFNKSKFELENGSKIMAAASSASAVRGYAINVLFCDEMDFIEHFDKFSASVLPTVSSSKNSKIIFCTTPNGMRSAYKYYVDSQEKRNDFKTITVTWQQVPGRDEEWKKQTLSALGGDLEKFAQEHEVTFLGSSGTLIAGWKLKELVHQTPVSQRDDLKVYRQPVLGHKYVLVADVSEGKGMDYSAFSVVDATKMPYEQVAVFRSNMIGGPDFAHKIHHLAKTYNDAQVLIEVNIAMGPEVAGILRYDLEYENVIHTKPAGAHGKKVSGGFGTNVDLGLRTTTKTKATGCSLLKLMIESNQLIINDYETISELSTFSRDTKKSFSAEPGKHDDLVMGLVLFSWLSTQNFFRDLTDIDTLGKLQEKTPEDMLREMPVFGYVDDHAGPDTLPDLAPGEQVVGIWH